MGRQQPAVHKRPLMSGTAESTTAFWGCIQVALRELAQQSQAHVVGNMLLSHCLEVADITFFLSIAHVAFGLRWPPDHCNLSCLHITYQPQALFLWALATRVSAGSHAKVI